MQNQSEYAIRERGGIPVHDYTRSGLPTSLSRRFSMQGLRSGWHNLNFDKVGRSLIVASLGLGLLELLMPKRVLKTAGMRGKKYTGLVRFLGFRELSSAMLIFAQSRPFTGVWSRVIGDAMDLGLLFAAFSSRRAKKNRVASTTAVIAGITALDVLTATQIGRVRAEAKRYSDFSQADMDTRLPGGAFRVTRSITINRPANELYTYWHNFENLPNFMVHLEMVSVYDQNRSHWVAKAPAGQHVEWTAEITQDIPDQMIAWRSVPGSEIDNSGEVRFEPATGGRGTVVRVQIEYHPPAGALGKIVAKLFGEEPGQQVADDLRRFKAVIETGEVLRSDGTPVGSGQKMQRPARPMHDTDMMRENKGEGKWDAETKRQREAVGMRESYGE